MDEFLGFNGSKTKLNKVRIYLTIFSVSRKLHPKVIRTTDSKVQSVNRRHVKIRFKTGFCVSESGFRVRETGFCVTEAGLKHRAKVYLHKQ
jgi:hypothetical protein